MRQPIFTLLLFSFLAISSSAPAVNQTQPSKEDWLAIFESANHSPIDRAKAAFELASLASKNKQTPTALDYAKGGLTLIGDDQIETTARLRYLLATIYLGEVNFTKAESELLWLSTNHHLLPAEINLGSIEERLGYLYVNTNQLDKALSRLQKAVKLLETDGLQLEHGKATKSLGDVYLYKSNYYQAIDHYEDALALLTPFTTEKDLKAGIFNNIGVAYNYLGKYPEAIENYSEALKLDRELDNYLGVGYSINNIAAINHTLGNRDLALKAYQEALDLGLKHDLTPILTLAYRNIANIQMDDGNLNEALDTFSKALFYAKKANNKREIAGIRANIGSIYSLKKQFNEALSELKKGLLIELEINNPTGTASAKIGIAGVYLEQGKIQSALKYATEALALTTELKMLKFEIQAREIIAALEKKRRNPDKAISQFEKILKLRDSLYSNQAKEALAQFQARFDSEKQRKRIELLEREQEIEALKSAELKKDNELKNQKLKETEMYRIITLAFLGLAIAIILLLLGSINKSRYIKQSKIKMRRILDNIDQGILTLNKNLKMESEHSRYIESLVDQSNNAKEDFFHQLLNSSNLNAEKKHIIEEVLSICMNEDEMQWMVNKEALPTSLTILSSEGEIERLLSLYWQPLYDQHAKVEGVLLSLHDVTERKKLEHQVQVEKERSSRLSRKIMEISKLNRSKAQTVINDAIKLKQELALATTDHLDLPKLLRELHTIKGGARSLGFLELSGVIHQTEAELIDWQKNNPDLALSLSIFEHLGTEIEEYKYILDELLGGSNEAAEINSLIASIAPVYEEIKKRIEGSNLAIKGLRVNEQIHHLPPEIAKVASNILVHSLNNCVDHGFLTPMKRGERVNPVYLEIDAISSKGALDIHIFDNGTGIDPMEIQQKAQDKGINLASGEDPLQLLFVDGFSSQDKATLTSGRGVGLSAIKAEVEEIGGQVEIKNREKGTGSVLTVHIPYEGATHLPSAL